MFSKPSAEVERLRELALEAFTIDYFRWRLPNGELTPLMPSEVAQWRAPGAACLPDSKETHVLPKRPKDSLLGGHGERRRVAYRQLQAMLKR